MYNYELSVEDECHLRLLETCCFRLGLNTIGCIIQYCLPFCIF